MANTFSFPSSYELTQIGQTYLADLTRDDPIFEYFPIQNKDAYDLEWEQRDNYKGLAQLRGLGGPAHRVNNVGAKRYRAQPGEYGEFMTIDEPELARRRPLGQFMGNIPIDDLVMERQEQLIAREVARIKYIAWTLATTGTFSVSLPDGGVAHTDTYSNQTFSAGTPWSTTATATPLANFRSLQLLSRGYSVGFGAGAKAFMNRTTANYLLANTNANDLAGKRTSGLANIMSVGEINNLLAMEDLPQMVIYDEGYYDDSGTFQLWIPNSKVVVFGQRPGNQPVGGYRMVRNVNNPDLAPGPYSKVVDNVATDAPPRIIKVHRGHSGGPILLFPSAVVVASV